MEITMVILAVMIEKNVIDSIEVVAKKGKVVKKAAEESGTVVRKELNDTIEGLPQKRGQRGNIEDTAHTAILLSDKAKRVMGNLPLVAKEKGSQDTEEVDLGLATETAMVQFEWEKTERRFHGHDIGTGTKHFLHMTLRRKRKLKRENQEKENIATTG